MRNLAILTFLTRDGVMQAPGSPEEDTSDGFRQGGWAVKYWDEVMAQVMEEAMSSPYELLLGRKTYESFAAYWPHAGDNPVANTLNSARKYVVTSTLNELEWNNSTLITGNIVEEISELKNQDGQLLQVHGSCKLIQTLLDYELIDEFRIWIFPVIVGKGKRLFDKGRIPTGLRLKKSGSTSNGVIMAIYTRE